MVNRPELDYRLRLSSIDGQTWLEALQCMEVELGRLGTLAPERIHVFFGGVHPLALRCGQLLRQEVKNVETIIYQFDVGAKKWLPFLCLAKAAPERRWPFAPVQAVGLDESNGEGAILAVDVARHSTDEQLLTLRSLVNARRIRRLRPGKEGTHFAAGEEALAALHSMQSSLDSLREAFPRGPLFFATSAPVSLVLGLGMRLPRDVYCSVWGCNFDSLEQRYYPSLEAIRGEIRPSSRILLEIFQKGIGVLFRLNGKLLEAVGDPLGGVDGIDRTGNDKMTLIHQAASFSQRCLPQEVMNAIQNRSPLDIEIQLGSEAAQLSWEMMRCPAETRFLVDYPDVTFTRVRPPSQMTYRARTLCNTERKLKILVAPTLMRTDSRWPTVDLEDCLKLHSLCQKLDSLGAEVEVLNYGTTVAELDDKIAEFKPDVLHWVCHGNPDQVQCLPSILEPSGRNGAEGVDRTEVPRFIRPEDPARPGGHRLKLLVLASCSAGDIRMACGLPDLLLEDGIEALVGFRDELQMADAQVFADLFYSAILQGESLRQAMRQARSKLIKFSTRPGAFASPLLCVRDPRAAGPLVERRER